MFHQVQVNIMVTTVLRPREAEPLQEGGGGFPRTFIIPTVFPLHKELNRSIRFLAVPQDAFHIPITLQSMGVHQILPCVEKGSRGANTRREVLFQLRGMDISCSGFTNLHMVSVCRHTLQNLAWSTPHG